MIKLIATFFLLSTSMVFANLHLAPPDFNTSQGRAVFVDFTQADYEITYDWVKEKVNVQSTIIFNQTKPGHPLFDLVPSATQVKINGEETKLITISSPDNITVYRSIDLSLKAGVHTLQMNNSFSKNVFFHDVKGGGVSSAFWIRDLKERKFLEQYIPSNLEFDQYQMSLLINFKNLPNPQDQEIYTNGKTTVLSPTQIKIEFPAYYTVSAPYFHTVPKGRMKIEKFKYTSIDGRDIQMTMYSPWKSRTQNLKRLSLDHIKELENDYGPWPFDFMIAYGTMVGTGGMEHSGATATSLAALDHEMLHCYFAKGIYPANGNSGWIDEAIASWRDRGYYQVHFPRFEASNLAGHSIYRRHTDSNAYALGAEFMAYLDFRLSSLGGLRKFLKGYFSAYKFTVITTEHFKNNLEFFLGENLDDDFQQFIYNFYTERGSYKAKRSSHHKNLSDKQLESMTIAR